MIGCFNCAMPLFFGIFLWVLVVERLVYEIISVVFQSTFGKADRRSWIEYYFPQIELGMFNKQPRCYANGMY